MNEEFLYNKNEFTGLTKVSIYALIKLVENKVEELNATDPNHAVIVFVYESENKHNIFQLCIYKSANEHCLIWRPFINNKLGNKIRTNEELEEFLGSYLYIEIEDYNLNDLLANMVANNKLTENELYKIRNSGTNTKIDNKRLQEDTKELINKNKDLSTLPTIKSGYGDPGNNPYLKQYNNSILTGKGEVPILTNEQLEERLKEGKVKQTKSGIYLVQH